MSVLYGAYGGTTALTVIGLCMSRATYNSHILIHLRPAVQWRRRSIQCTLDPCCRGGLLKPSDWKLPREHIALCLGQHRHSPLHRPLSHRRSLVRRPVRILNTKKLTPSSKGHFHNRHVDPGRWRQSTADTNQEPHLDHLLRGRRHLRRHHVHCLQRKGHARVSGCDTQRQQLLHRVRAVLVGRARRDV